MAESGLEQTARRVRTRLDDEARAARIAYVVGLLNAELATGGLSRHLLDIRVSPAGGWLEVAFGRAIPDRVYRLQISERDGFADQAQPAFPLESEEDQ